MINFNDMGVERFSKDYKNMNPAMLELVQELYKENKQLPDLEQLSPSQLDQEIKNNTANAYTGLDLRLLKEKTIGQEGLLKDVLNGLLSTQEEIKQYKETTPKKKEINPKDPDMITKMLQALVDVPEETKKNVEHFTDKSVIEDLINKALVSSGAAVGITPLEADEFKPMTKEEYKLIPGKKQSYTKYYDQQVKIYNSEHPLSEQVNTIAEKLKNLPKNIREMK